MDDRRLPRFRKGDPFPSAQQLNDLVDAIRRLRIMPGQGTGVLVNETPNGTSIRVRSSGAAGQLARTSGVVTARSSLTAGTGNVVLCTMDPSSALITVTTQTQKVFNFSATPNTGIPDGKFCWIEQDPQGNWWVVSAEC